MRLAWFTPFCRPSAIGKVSQAVTAELARHATVDIWTAHEHDLHATDLRVFAIASLGGKPDALASYDHVVYNLGDHWGYHGEIFKTFQQLPGVLILHDFVMHHFFLGYYLEDRDDPDGYLEGVSRLYGRRARQEAAQWLEAGPELVETEQIARYPFFEPCLAGAQGVIAHSAFVARAVKTRALAPVERLALPSYRYEQRLPLEPAEAVKAGLGLSRDKLLLLTTGIVNPNKRIDVVIEVLGRDPELARQVEYLVIGDLVRSAYEQRLTELIRAYHLEGVVRLLGHQSEEVLHQYLSCADLCVNLRNPPMNGGSASLVEGLYFGRPMIVSDCGCYRDVPDDCVVKVPVQGEAGSLAGVLRDLIADRARRQQLGRRGREYVLANHSPARYARGVLEFLDTVARFKPRLDLLARVNGELAGLGVPAGSALVGKVSRELEALWPPPELGSGGPG